jgi:hypothetical protein
MEKVKHTEQLREGCLFAFEIKSSLAYLAIQAAGMRDPDVIEDDEDLLPLVKKIRKPILIIAAEASKYKNQHPRARRLYKIASASESRQTDRLTPSDKQKDKTGKQRKKLRNFLTRVFNMMQGYKSELNHGFFVSNVIRLLNHIINSSRERNDILTDIHILVASKLEEEAHSCLEQKGTALRAKLDRALSCRELAQENKPIEVSLIDIIKTIIDWVINLLKGINLEKKPWTVADIINHAPLRQIYMETVQQYAIDETSWRIGLRTLLKKSFKEDNDLLLFDLLLFCFVQLEINRRNCSEEFFYFYFHKLNRYAERSIVSLKIEDKQNLQNLLYDFLDDFENQELTCNDSGFDSRFSNDESRKIEGIDFEEIARDDSPEDKD